MTKGEILKTCSLWTAFDKMQLCFTLAPQVFKIDKLKNYYRYGEWKSCQNLIDEFQFCWSMKSLSDKQIHKEVTEREQQKYNKKTRQRPSVGIWQVFIAK